jgi:hypothetical protein
MSSFAQHYRALYDTFGHPLSDRTGMSPMLLAVAEKGLRVRIPAALRAYYLVPGRERRFFRKRTAPGGRRAAQPVSRR